MLKNVVEPVGHRYNMAHVQCMVYERLQSHT